MVTENLISVVEFCKFYNVEVSFINSLQDYELIEITMVKQAAFIHQEQLNRLEKLVRLHYDLDVNLEGLDVIHHLLERIETMQLEMLALKNKLARLQNE